MFVSETRRLLEANEFLREYFREKKNPTIRDLILYLKTVDQTSDFDSPSTNLSDHGVAYQEEASATKQNNMIDSLRKDLTNAYDNIMINAEENDNFYNANFSRLSQILGKFKELESRVNSLLALSSLTDGYFQVVDDPLISEEYIDKENTDAFIDVSTQSVTISDKETNLHNTMTLSQTNRYLPNFSGENPPVVSFGILDRSHLVSSKLWGGSTGIQDAFLDPERSWKQQVISSKQTGVTGELKIDFREQVSLTTIVFRKDFAGERGVTSMNVLYSTDGSSYLPVPSSSIDFVMNDVIFVTFPSTKMRYVKFVINKYHYDEVLGSNYVYYLGASLIEFYSKAYSDSEAASSTFVSTPRTVSDEDEETYPITWVGIDVCETADTNNYINYSVSFDTGTTFYPISPTSYQNARHPKNISVASTIEEERDTVVVPDATGTSQYDLVPTGIESYYKYPGKEYAYNVPLGRVFSEATTPQLDIQNSINNNISVYRNVGVTGAYGYNCYKFELEEVPKGWRFDGVFYTTIMTIDSGKEIAIDFGPNPIYINGVKKTGVYSFVGGDYEIGVKPGNFSAPTNNDAPDETQWSITEVLEDDGAGTFTDRFSKTYSDTLYPYNHRLLIEGLPYASDFTGKQIYLGGDKFSAYKMKKVPELTFLRDTNKLDYTKFATVIGEFDSAQLGYILLKSADDVIIDKDRGLEYFDVKVDVYQDDRFTADSVVLKAVLNSTNGSTPVFHGYRLKLGVIKDGA